MFPNLLADKAEKLTEKFGLTFAKAFWAEFNKGGFFEWRREKYRELRRWRNGTQSVDNIIDMMNKTNSTLAKNTSYRNLNYTPISIIPVFADGMLGGFMGNGYKASVNAVDKISKTKKHDWLQKEINRIIFAPILNEIESTSGIPIEKSKFESEEEANIYQETELKIPIEIAFELTCEDVLNNSDKDELEKRLADDLITLEVAWGRVYYDKNYRTKVRYVDPEFIVTSKSMKPDFSDIDVAGEIIYMSISDLGKDSGLPKSDLIKIANIYTGRAGNPARILPYETNTEDNSWLNNLVPVMDFEFLSLDKEPYRTYKKMFGKTRTKRGVPTSDSEKLTLTDEVNKYSGKWVVDTDYIYNYGLAKNQVIPVKGGEYTNEAKLSFKGYAPNIRENINKSRVERMIPYAEAMHIAHLQLQHFLTEAKPPGLAINVAGFEGVNLGKGIDPATNPLEINEYYLQKGSYYFNSKDDEGNSTGQRPVTPLLNPIGEIEKLMEVYNFNQSILKSMIGDPLSALQPQPKQAVGVTEFAQEATQRTMIPLRQAWSHILENICDDIIIMARDKALYAPAIGDFHNSLLQMTKELPLCELGMSIKWKPDNYERAEISKALDFDIQKGELRAEDKVFIMTFDNVKQQLYYMRVRREKYSKERIAEAAANIDRQSAKNAESGQAVEAAKTQGEMKVLEGKKQLVLAETDSKLTLMREQARLDAEKERKKNEYAKEQIALTAQLKPDNAKIS